MIIREGSPVVEAVYLWREGFVGFERGPWSELVGWLAVAGSAGGSNDVQLVYYARLPHPEQPAGRLHPTVEGGPRRAPLSMEDRRRR